MPYILNKTNGLLLTTVEDATVNNTYSLTFLGKNFTGYGQAIEENFVKLLENFANSLAPSNPIAGQLWFNTSTQQLNISNNGLNWKGVGSVSVGSTSTVNLTPTEGDLFWDSQLSSLIVYDGSSYITIGPYSASTYASWTVGRITSDINTGNQQYPAIVGSLRGSSGLEPMVAFSNPAVPSYVPDSIMGSDYAPYFNSIQRGITLRGANTSTTVPSNSTILVPGSSINSGYYFWGTAAESLATVTVELTTTTNFNTCFIPFAGTTLGATPLLTTSTFSYEPSTGVLNATATSAYYADLAERYEADAVYDEGTVLVIGGEKEVTVTATFADTRVAGVVSKNPAYLMNKDAGTDETHPAIALKGRVPCKVQGYIKKGDLIVTSSIPGYGIAASNVFGGAIIGKALGSQSEGFGVIEILVV